MTKSIRSLVIGALGVAGLATSATEARADEAFTQGKIILSADRLSPLLSYTSSKESSNNGSLTDKQTDLSLLWSGRVGDFYDVPRLAFDFVVAPHITIGGAFGATIPLSHSTESSNGNTTTTTDADTTSALAVGVRGGYVLDLGPKVALWGRLGLGYSRLSTKSPNNNDSTSTYSEFALSIEPLFAFPLTPHFGLLAGPVFDIPLSGNHHQESTVLNTTVSSDNDFSQLHIGLTVGVFGVL